MRQTLDSSEDGWRERMAEKAEVMKASSGREAREAAMDSAAERAMRLLVRARAC